MGLTVTETGQDKLSLRWRDSPPLAPLATVEDCARDFLRLFPEAGDRDPVADWTAEAESWAEAVHRACLSLDRNGKTHNHQSRVPRNARNALANAIMSDPYLGDLLVDGFDDLHDGIEYIGERIEGIGPVTTYDVAWRLAYWLGIEPTSLYLHAGVEKGAKALGMDTRGRDRFTAGEMTGTPLGRAVKVLGDVNTLEDFLCCYRRVFELIRGGVTIGPDTDDVEWIDDEEWEWDA